MQRTYQFDGTLSLKLPDKAMAGLMQIGHRKSFADGQIFMQHGDACNGFWVVTKGQAMIGRYAEDGGLTVFAVVGEGDVFGELAYFADVPRQADAVADGPVELLWIDAAQCRRMLEQDVDIALLLLRSLARQFQGALNRIDADRERSTILRLAKLLRSISQQSGTEIPTTQQQLADQLGVSRVALGQALRRLRNEGLVQPGYGRMIVRDPVALSQWIDRQS